MGCEVTDSEAITKAARPDSSNVPVPSVLAPSLNVTVPVGVPIFPVTVAVKVSDWPNTEGFWEELTVVEVGALVTVTLALVLVASDPSASVDVTVGVPAVVEVELGNLSVRAINVM